MAGLTKLKVLVVDDNRHVRGLVKQVLVAVDAQVEEAADGMSALAFCRATPPDIVIVDFEMPKMSGAEFTRALREQQRETGARIAVLLMTAHGDARRVTEASAAGVDGVVAKPLSPQRLFERIQAALLHNIERSGRVS